MGAVISSGGVGSSMGLCVGAVEVVTERCRSISILLKKFVEEILNTGTIFQMIAELL